MSKTEKVSISSIKNNPNNPRLLKDDKFAKLVKSIKEFPEMLKLRPIVVDEDNVVLGGNMRLKALKSAGEKEVFIIRAENLTEEQKKEFIIKDNSNFWSWDYSMLANEWEASDLENWGLDVDFWGKEIDFDNIEWNEDRDVSSNEQKIVCPNCSHTFNV